MTASEDFQRALDAAGRGAEAEPTRRVAPFAGPALGRALDVDCARGGGGEARWDLASAWADAPTPPPADPEGDLARLAEAVARDLNFEPGLAAPALAARWRAFVWRNHPDRQPPEARALANARVALANALYERARRA